MGQAFDKHGDVLGEAFGQTKREVFDQLTEAHPDAAEIRIRTLEAGASSEMPRYKSHKTVWALKIAGVRYDSGVAKVENRETDGSALLDVETPFSAIRVDADYVRKHNPQAGGYYVVYADGYKSFSPAEAFESGYSRL